MPDKINKDYVQPNRGGDGSNKKRGPSKPPRDDKEPDVPAGTKKPKDYRDKRY